MSGWRRLWIVASILLGIPALIIGYDSEKQFSSYQDAIGNESNAAFWARVRLAPALEDCDWGSAKAEHSYGKSYRITCRNPNRHVAALMWASLPAFLLALVGLTLRWIYHGFRPSQK